MVLRLKIFSFGSFTTDNRPHSFPSFFRGKKTTTTIRPSIQSLGLIKYTYINTSATRAPDSVLFKSNNKKTRLFPPNTYILLFKHSIFSTSSIKTKCFAVSIVKNRISGQNNDINENVLQIYTAACQANKGESTNWYGVISVVKYINKRKTRIFFLSSFGMAAPKMS